ncbi:MAG: TolC family protein [Kofleriaceae bacterium]
MSRVRRVVLLLSLSLSGTVSAAPEGADVPYVPPEFLAVTPPLPAGVAGGNVLRLDLAETLRIAVRQNLDVVLERKQVVAAEYGIAVARGIFEPTVTAGYSHNDSQTPPASLQEGEATDIITFVDDAWRIGLVQRFASGTRVDVEFSNGRAKSTGGTAVQPLNYRSTLGATLTQPLFRGFSPDLAIPKLEVLRAKIASDRERQQLTASIMTIVERAETAYWGVLLSLYRHDVAVRSYKAAEDQRTLTQRQIDAGLLPSSDLISAESALAQRRVELLQAEEATQASMDLLRSVMNLPRAEWSRPILPIDVPHFAPGGATAEDSLVLALKNRPELAQLDLDLKSALLSTRKAENDRLPQVDLGLTGTLFGQDSEYRGALSQLSSTDARAWGVFVNLIWTPLQRSSSAAAAIARIQQDQTQVRKEQLVQAVWFEVREAVRNQVGAERRVKAAGTFRELAEKSLEIEQRKFLNGTSQNITVSQRQDAVAAARLAELDALLAHTRARTTLFKATGRLLAERHIELTK